MKNSVQLYGVKTNNLKNIDVTILKNKVTTITGVSGGGKSSLAYDTIFALCQQEFSAISDGYYEDARYLVDRYEGIAPAVAIRQINRNSNPRSTIYSYFNFFSLLGSLPRNKENNFDYDRLRLNKFGNECPACGGAGVVHRIDENKVVDDSRTLSQNPFVAWESKVSNKYEKLLEAYCVEMKLDRERAFGKLPLRIRRELLYGDQIGDFLIKFKHSGRYRQRRMPYTGPISELQKCLKSSRVSERAAALKFSSQLTCEACRGSRISAHVYSTLKVCGIPMGEFLSQSIDQNLVNLEHYDCVSAAFAKLQRTLRALSTLGLGYLSLSRSIPSLSGGEIQKLNFSRLMVSDIAGLIVVVDEISSQVHVSDYFLLFNEIEKLKRLGNTVVLVEHNAYFVERSDNVIEIGPAPGHCGGQLVKHTRPAPIYPPSTDSKHLSLVKLPRVWKNNVKGISLEVAEGGLTVICGKSGTGKSSIAEFLSENVDDVLYISQGFIRGHIRSSVASYLELISTLAQHYASSFSMGPDCFSPSAGKIGGCTTCGGTGVVRVDRDYDSAVDIDCPTCNGRLFSPAIDIYKIEGLGIADVYELPFKELLEHGFLPKKLSNTLEMLCSLGLGHLSLNRKTLSLSGGELRRLKLLKFLSKRKSGRILIVDEPGAGLDDATCQVMMRYLNSYAESYKAIVLIDHKPSIFLNCDYLIEIGGDRYSSSSQIVYEGRPAQYYRDRYAPCLAR